ncbi:hypothetical protein ACFOKJ_13435, partial [Vogesella amnigena]
TDDLFFCETFLHVQSPCHGGLDSKVTCYSIPGGRRRDSNGNANDRILEFLPKGTGLPVLSQEELDAISHGLNTPPRAVLKFKMQIEEFAEPLDAVIDSRQAEKH